MNAPVKKGAPIVGLIMLGIGVFNLLKGDNWVVWFILAALFGAFGYLFGKKDGAA